ncbi:MAG: Heat shock protein [Chlamydiales bacterium]|nr:Heat shock protein [Chlamydiales bacterium]
MAKRILLFVAVNILIVLTVSFILNMLNIQPYLTAKGLDYQALTAFCLIWGMAGAFISLLLSKVMAKWMMGVQIIDPMNCSEKERDLYRTVEALARKAGLNGIPEVGIYESEELNAFATGPTQSSSLVAVSSGLLSRMNKDELEGVLGHEIAHIANGDMVTMTLLQGIINAFVMFLARVVAFAIMQLRSSSSDSEESSTEGMSWLIYNLVVFALELVFMVLGTMVIAAYSRWREFHADKGGADYSSRQKMIAALEFLKKEHDNPVPVDTEQKVASSNFRAMMISNKSSGILHLFATHPPLEDRIARLKGSQE